jgi:hypothetical protein
MNLLRTVMLMVYSSRHKGGFKKVMSEMNISLKGPEDALELCVGWKNIRIRWICAAKHCGRCKIDS